ncbi:fasciclin-like arabinogalactan protein 3 [Andrographis paniculata]|uniref:fasciclin-like arabinogalactan protein 3 n=1 Tax=Andrographis paniculata TaxID=175694 RepID=UPI0021E93D90|nr:fasciclin-like arabinogalactan protein 3 [Andrographis paniculata]
MVPASSTAAAAVILWAVLSSSAAAFNVTQILGQHPEYSQFNDLLSKTGVAGEINSRQTITVLAVGNDAAGEISSKAAEVQKRILSTHVALDYFDAMKLNGIKDNGTVITTLFQTTGAAQNRQGFITVGHDATGAVAFGSAAAGSPVDAKLLGVVAAQPYNISVLHISHPIMANGIDGNWTAAPPAPAAKSPAPSTGKTVSDAPAASDSGAAAPAPAASPAAKSPAAAAAPGSAPAPSPADGPGAADAPSGNDSPADQGSSAAKQVVSGAAAVASLVVALLQN